MRIEFHNPEMDKNFSFHFFGTLKEIKKVRKIHCQLTMDMSFNVPAFLQGYDPSCGWAMIEMWTKDIEKIVLFKNELEELTGCIVTDFDNFNI